MTRSMDNPGEKTIEAVLVQDTTGEAQALAACPDCGALVFRQTVAQHMRWHALTNTDLPTVLGAERPS